MLLQPYALALPTTASGGGVLRAMAAGDLVLSTPSNATVAASNVVSLYVGQCNVMSLYRTHVDIRGALNVEGAFGTLASDTVATNELYVANNVVRLATVIGSVQPGEAAVDGAGLHVSEVAGEPAPLQERSVRWRASRGGTAAMLLPGACSNASYWEVKGGGLRITSARRGPAAGASGAGQVSYLLHINEREELEVVKRWTVGATESFMRVCAFGRAPQAGAASGLL